MRRGALDGSLAAILGAVLMLAPACATPAAPPPRAADLVEEHPPGPQALHRAYPSWATAIGPLPGHLVGLLLPAESRWGRSMTWIGEGYLLHAEAYGHAGPKEPHPYQLYAAGVSPRQLSFAGEEISPGTNKPWGLSEDAHLAEVEISNGFGSALTNTFTASVTRVRLLDGQPGYPEHVTALLDSARAQFDGFVRQQAPEIQRLLRAEAAASVHKAPVPPREAAVEALFPYWDEARHRLVVLFRRHVTRMVEYSVPCEFVYQGMPPKPEMMSIRYGSAIDLGQQLELDANGALVALRSFAPTVTRTPPPSGAEEDSQSKGFRVCPGSPGARERGTRPLELPSGYPGRPPSPPSACGNGQLDRQGVQPEECDGGDLGGQSCQSVGFLGGRLGCTPACKFDLASCEATSAPEQSVPRALEGDAAGLAVLGDRLLLAAARGPLLQLHFVDARTLQPVGKATSWTLPAASGYALERLRIVPTKDGALLAAGTLPNRQTLVLRVSAEGDLSGPTATVAGHSAFFVAGRETALLGVETSRTVLRLDAVRIDAAGKALGALEPILEAAPGTSFLVAAAGFTGTGWTVAAGNGGNPFLRVLRFSRVGLEGKRTAGGELQVETGQLAIAPRTGSAFVVQAHSGGIVATELFDSGAHGPPRLIAQGLFPRVVAAAVEGGVLVAWASDHQNRLQRLELDLSTGATGARTAIRAPMIFPGPGVVRDGTLFHLFQLSPRSNDYPEGYPNPSLRLMRAQ